MRILLLCLCLLLAGCGGGDASRGPLMRYLHQVDPFEVDLDVLLREMKAVPSLPVLERAPALLKLADRVKARHAELVRVEAPPQATAFHAKLGEMYDCLEQIVRKNAAGTGDQNEPELKKLNERWGALRGEAEAELAKLDKH